MSYPVTELPDISGIGGHWTLAPARDCATGGHLQVGRAIFAGRQWPREPKDCVCVRGDWYLDGNLLLCSDCGTDGT
ncbi:MULTISPECIES: hypothetical protein [Nocardia]|uniref:hypothetical protein n=1 Tax=Nocardia TaxID=1817 RepID=UPI000D697BFB|nr:MULTISPECIES: hypothetical protein [Nocardia]